MLMIRPEAILLTLIVLTPLIPIALPAPPLPQLPAPKIAGLLPAPPLRPLTAERRIAAMDDELRQIFGKSLKTALSFRKPYQPLFP